MHTWEVFVTRFLLRGEQTERISDLTILIMIMIIAQKNPTFWYSSVRMIFQNQRQSKYYIKIANTKTQTSKETYQVTNDMILQNIYMANSHVLLS